MDRAWSDGIRRLTLDQGSTRGVERGGRGKGDCHDQTARAPEQSDSRGG